MAAGFQAHPMRSAAREAGIAMVAFTTAGAGAPTGVVDDGGVISSTIAHVGGTGVYTLSLNKQWKRVRAVATCEDATAGVFCKVTGHVEGFAATNTITIQTELEAAGTLAAGDTTGPVISVIVYLSR